MSKVNIIDGIRSSVSPVSNNDLVSVFFAHGAFPFFLVSVVLLQLVDSVKARSGAHEFKNGVHADHCAELALHGSGLETSPDLETRGVDDDGVLNIKETRSLSNLLE